MPVITPEQVASPSPAASVQEAPLPVDASGLRILIVLHMPWSRDLGGPRVAMELAEQWEAHGAQVDHFSLTEAFPRPFPLLRFFHWALFPGHAIRHVRRYGKQYHVIVAEQGNLPLDKGRLGFRGLLVARSSGLFHFHDAYLREERERKRRAGEREGSLAGNLLRSVADWMAHGKARAERSFVEADRILLLNGDEQEFVEQRLGHRGKCWSAPNGVSRERLTALRAAAASAVARQARPTVAFIGYWCPLKGSQQFPELVRRVRERCPDVRFKLLGTKVPEAEVLSAFPPEDRAALTVVPQFRSEELPGLLAEATVGVLPSGMEGFGLAVLELMASGLPTYAYDVPGPRVMLSRCRESHVAPCGNIAALAELLVPALTASPQEYQRLRQEATTVAEGFIWEEIAAGLLSKLVTAHAALHAGEPERAS